MTLAHPVGARPGQALPDHAGRAVPPDRRARPRRRRGLAGPPPRRDARGGGRVGLREVDARPGPDAPDPADRGHGDLRGRGPLRQEGRGADGLAARHADRPAGPVHLAEPAQDRRRHRRRTLRHPPRGGAEGRPPAAGAGAARGGRAQPRAHPALPAPVLGRTAPAHRDRAGAGPAAQGDRVRRARLGARRVDPGPGAQPARRPAARVRAGVPVHRPRPRRRAPPLRPRRGDVPGLDRGDRERRGDLPAREPPVHAGAAVVGAGARPLAARAPRGDPAHRRRSPAAAPRTRPRAAASARGARRPSPCARRSPRRSRSGRPPTTPRRATSPSPRTWSGRSSPVPCQRRDRR